MFLSLAPSGCQPDGSPIVLKDSREHGLPLSLTETVQFGKQRLTRVPWRSGKLKGERLHHLELLPSLLHSCFSKCLSAEWELVYCVPSLSELTGREGGRDRGGGKEILIETWRHSLRQVVYRPTDSALRVLCRDAGVQSQKSKLFFSKLNCLRPLRGFIIPVRPV